MLMPSHYPNLRKLGKSRVSPSSATNESHYSQYQHNKTQRQPTHCFACITHYTHSVPPPRTISTRRCLTKKRQIYTHQKGCYSRNRKYRLVVDIFTTLLFINLIQNNFIHVYMYICIKFPPRG